MNCRRGFSIVEALVATALVGVASAALAAALTVRTALRRQAGRDAVAARVLHEVSATLARRPCTAVDTSAAQRVVGADVRWQARRVASAWEFLQSVEVGGAVIVSEGRVPCA